MLVTVSDKALGLSKQLPLVKYPLHFYMPNLKNGSNRQIKEEIKRTLQTDGKKVLTKVKGQEDTYS